MTFEEAARHQIAVRLQVDNGDWDPDDDFRFASLHPDYCETHRRDMGHSFNMMTNKVCGGGQVWDETHTVMICQECFYDGT